MLLPEVPAGAVQVNVVSSTTVTEVAAVAPKLIALVPGLSSTKPLPVIVIVAPPAAGPDVGDTPVTVGSAW